jgi:hypothetical protein
MGEIIKSGKSLGVASYLVFLIALIVLHVSFYSILERFSILTIIYAIMWSTLALGAFAAISLKTHRPALAIAICSSLIAILYFAIYVFYVFPSFVEFRVFGIDVVHKGNLTAHGLIYLLFFSIMEGVMIIAAALLSRVFGKSVTR